MSISRDSARGGFTLIELMVAVAILMIFGGMAAATLGYASSMWRQGHRRSYAYDTATVIFQQIEDDLSAAKNPFWGAEADAYDERIRFWLDHDPHFDGDEDTDGGRQRLRFVRGIPDDTVNPRLRQAGDGVSNDDDNGDGLIDSSDPADEELYNLMDDDPAGDERIDEDLMPLEGLCEVAYLLGLGADGTTPQTERTTLYRAVLSPIGDDSASPDDPETTFFLEADGITLGAGNDDTLGTSERIANKAVALAENVLYFEVRAWTQYTTTWEVFDEDGDEIGFFEWANSYEPEECAPVLTWDSTRSEDDETPDFDMDQDQGLAGGGDYVGDNVFPRAVMVIVTIAPPEHLRQANPLRLRADVTDPAATVLQVTGQASPFNRRWPFVRVNDEWMLVTEFDQQTNEITVERGVRGTSADTHDAGDRVMVGYTFSRIFRNPAPRDDWGQL